MFIFSDLTSAFKRKKLSQMGFSFTELLLAITIGVFLAIQAGLLLSNTSQLKKNLEHKFASEEGLYQAAYYIKNSLSQALLVTSIGNNSITGFNSNIGQIRDYDATAAWPPIAPAGNGKIVPVAIFLRDNLISNYHTIAAYPFPTQQQRFLGSGIFYQESTTNRYGMLYISLNSDPLVITLSPADSDIKISHVVDFKIRSADALPFDNSLLKDTTLTISQDNDLFLPTVPPTPMAMTHSVIATVTIRYYLKPNPGPGDQFTWCPPNIMNVDPACATQSTYKDQTKDIVINLRNNILGRTFSQRSVIFGPHYQPTYRRALDTVYFLKTNYPAKSLFTTNGI